MRVFCLISVLLAAMMQGIVGPNSRNTGALDGTVEGVVVDALTGRPIPGAEVIVFLFENNVAGFGGNGTPMIELSDGVLDEDALQEGKEVFGTPRYFTLADLSGRFVFSELQQGLPESGRDTGAFRLFGRADGYALQEFGYEVPGEPAPEGSPATLSLRGGENHQLTIRLTPFGRVGGRVTDPEDHPVDGLEVILLEDGFFWTGERRFRSVTRTISDEAGKFDLGGVAPGRYFIAVGSPTSVGGGDGGPTRVVYPWTWYPGVLDGALASGIDVFPGTVSETYHVIVTPRGSFRIAGHVMNDNTGRPQDQAFLNLIADLPFPPLEYPLFVGSPSQRAVSDADGAFEFVGLNAGLYRLSAGVDDELVYQVQGPVLRDGLVSVVVSDSDVDDLEVHVNARGSFRGRFSIEGGTLLGEADPPFTSGALQIILRSADRVQPSQSGGAVVDLSDGTFEIVPSLFGTYRYLVVGLPRNFYVAEASLNGARVTGELLRIPEGVDNTLELVLRPDGGEIVGAVVDERGDPQRGIRGLLLPDPPPLQGAAIGASSREFTTDPEGAVELKGVAPGTYLVFAWRDIGPDEYFDPLLLRASQPDATRVTVDPYSRLPLFVDVIE